MTTNADVLHTERRAIAVQCRQVRLKAPLLLASGSKRRKMLLSQIGIAPDIILSPDVDEEVCAKESVGTYTQRIARMKVLCFRAAYPDHIILSADTAVLCSRKILVKPQDARQAREFLQMLSGRRHRVYTAVCCCVPDRGLVVKIAVSIVKMKRLQGREIDFYIATGEWENKAGGYAIQGFAAAFVEWMRGSYSNVVGLPLCQVYKVLDNYLLY